ncbi:MAG: hypothetical protein J2P15_10185 [Micromonosporaceae bacterium]|nr:hypothetical protein [Micromonosporaceae bacterium]
MRDSRFSVSQSELSTLGSATGRTAQQMSSLVSQAGDPPPASALSNADGAADLHAALADAVTAARRSMKTLTDAVHGLSMGVGGAQVGYADTDTQLADAYSALQPDSMGEVA